MHACWLAAILIVSPAFLKATDLSLSEKEEFLRTAAITQKVKLATGVTRSTRATLSSQELSHDAHIQSIDFLKLRHRTRRGEETNFRDSWKYNVAAYRLSRLLQLNMVPPSVERADPGSPPAAITWWVDNVLADELTRRKKNLLPPDPKEYSKQVEMMRVFDELICNIDRNTGNILITQDWQLWMIDHTRAFRRTHTLWHPNLLNRIDRNVLAALERLDRSVLKSEMKSLLDSEEIDSLLHRRDALLKLFAKRRSHYGDDAILFDLNR